jgi:predicted dehydrogenase
MTIGWGILGCGGIARQFSRSLAAVEAAQLIAVASASGSGKAKSFADELKEVHGEVTSYDSYQALLADSTIEAVYVANTHNFHHETVLLALAAGKHVLCEKPLTVNARQARECIEAATAAKRFLMEAMWTRFLPACAQLRAWIAEGRIGQVQHIYAGFGFPGNWATQGRMLNRELAGGCMLDMGIYPLSFASMIMAGQPPESISSRTVIGETGVDIDGTYLLTYPDDATAICQTSFTVSINTEARVVGSKGSVTLPATFIGATEVRLQTSGEDSIKRFPVPDGTGFQYEIAHTCQCIEDGLLESPIMPLAETLTLARTMDALRSQCDLRYPADED